MTERRWREKREVLSREFERNMPGLLIPMPNELSPERERCVRETLDKCGYEGS